VFDKLWNASWQFTVDSLQPPKENQKLDLMIYAYNGQLNSVSFSAKKLRLTSISFFCIGWLTSALCEWTDFLSSWLSTVYCRLSTD